MDLNIILHPCESVKVDPPAVPTVIVLFGGLLFLLVAVISRYVDFFCCMPHPNSCRCFLFLWWVL